MTASPSDHRLLRGVIRLTGISIALLSIIIFLPTLVVATVTIFFGQLTDLYSGLCVILIQLMFSFLGLLTGWRMFRLKSPSAIYYFSTVFAILWGITLYQFLPLSLPPFASHLVGHAPFMAQGSELGISYRATMAFISFLLLNAILEDYLFRVLKFEASAR